MIVRMCGRCQEEIDKERQKVQELEKQIEDLKAKLNQPVKIYGVSSCPHIGDWTGPCPYCEKPLITLYPNVVLQNPDLEQK